MARGYTVWRGLCWARPNPHERVAVLGIGGLRHLAVQFARASGLKTIATSRSPDKDKMIKELGADEIGSLGGLKEMRLGPRGKPQAALRI
jgi:D-arabinose 1-dehydrogenase-like Zn-dependent alcohol dehydrogenase